MVASPSYIVFYPQIRIFVHIIVQLVKINSCIYIHILSFAALKIASCPPAAKPQGQHSKK